MLELTDQTQFDASLHGALQNFEPITLEASQRAALMNRGEAKYLLNIGRLLEMLPALSQHYQVLEIDGNGLMGYLSTYYDTPEFALYLDHHNGRSRRHKVRYREYLQTQTTFLEVKVRSISGATRKDRVVVSAATPEILSSKQEFLTRKSGDARALEPKLEVYCQRLTLVSMSTPERLTFDFNLGYCLPDGTPGPQFHRAVIAELKYERGAGRSIFAHIAREHGLRHGGYSKYSVGCGLMYKDIKHNNFKPQIQAIRKAEYGYHA
jgi:hypothetical protein